MYWSIQARKCSKCGCETAAKICPTCYAEEIRRDKERHQGYDHWKYFLGDSQEHGKDVATNVCEKSHKNSKTSSNNGEKMDSHKGERATCRHCGALSQTLTCTSCGLTRRNVAKYPDKYFFTVTDPNQVDVDRIIKENPEAKIIAISLPDSLSVLVLIRKSFAEKFTPHDYYSLGEMTVCSNMPAYYFYDKNQYYQYCTTFASTIPDRVLKHHDGWLCVDASRPEVFEQIERILNFKKKSVTVRTW